MHTWRLLRLSSHTPYENMAIDEAVLSAYEQGRVGPTLRLYGWEPAGISLGFGQSLAAVNSVCPEIPRVRRMTGGEAIFHDRELTYSLVTAPNELNLPRSVRESYLALGAFLIAALASFNVSADYFGIEPEVDSECCFAKPRRFDLAVQGKKIGGHAQRRRKNVLFQHGSIPLTLDYCRWEKIFNIEEKELRRRMTSLSEAAGQDVTMAVMAARVTTAFERAFGVELREAGLTVEETRHSAELARDKYATRLWNESRRTHEFRGINTPEPCSGCATAGMAV